MVVKSMVRMLVLSMAMLSGALLPGTGLHAHEIQPAIADVEVGETKVTLTIRMALESLAAGINLEGLSNTNDAPEAALYDLYRYMPPEEFEAALREAWPRIAQGFVIESGGRQVLPRIEMLAIPAVGNLEFPRDSVITLSADLPEGDAPVVLGWRASYGQIVIRQVGVGDASYEAFLTYGDLSAPIPRAVPEGGFVARLWRAVTGWF